MKKIKHLLNVLLVCMLAISSSITAFAAEKASYRVVFYDESGAQIKEDIREGTVGEEVYVDIDDLSDFGDYVFDGVTDKHVMNTTVKKDGTSQLSLYFKNNSSTNKVGYIVKWFYGDKLLKSEERKADAGTNVSIIGMDTDVLEIGSKEYSFDVGNSNNVFSTTVEEDGSSELKLYFVSIDSDVSIDDDTAGSTSHKASNAAKAVYTVLWLTNDEGKEIRKDIREGIVGEQASIDPDDLEAFDGYSFDNGYDAQVTMAEIEPDGTTELKLYFNDNNPARAAANKITNTNAETSNKTTEETTASKSGTPVFTPVVQTRSSETVQASNTSSTQSRVQTGASAPKTGDETPLIVLAAALIVSAGAIIIIVRSKMNKNDRRRIYR